MEAIDESVMAEALEYDAVVCLVTVRSSEVTLAGTRSARFAATVDVEESLHGECGETMEVAGHARNDQSPLEQGGRYVIAATPSARVAPALQLEGQARASGADAAQVVEVHRALIRRLLGQ